MQSTTLTELRVNLHASVEFHRRFFNHHCRSHQGYRTQGRTPGKIFLSREGIRDKRQRFQSVSTYPVQDTLVAATGPTGLFVGGFTITGGTASSCFCATVLTSPTV